MQTVQSIGSSVTSLRRTELGPIWTGIILPWLPQNSSVMQSPPNVAVSSPRASILHAPVLGCALGRAHVWLPAHPAVLCLPGCGLWRSPLMPVAGSQSLSLSLSLSLSIYLYLSPHGTADRTPDAMSMKHLADRVTVIPFQLTHCRCTGQQLTQPEL